MKMVKYAVVLGLICIASAFGVSGTFYVTRTRIADKTLVRQLVAQALAVKMEVAQSPEFVTLRSTRPTGTDVLEAHTADGKVLGYFEPGTNSGKPSADGVICYFATKRIPAGETESEAQSNLGLDASGKLVCTFAVFEFMYADPDHPEPKKPEQIVVARDGSGEVKGYIAQGDERGYGGKIVVMVGMDLDANRIKGMAIVLQTETPGLGTRIAEVRCKKTWGRIFYQLLCREKEDEPEETMPWFLRERFIGRTYKQLKGQVDGKKTHIDAITGATISSKATVKAAWRAADKIRQGCAQIAAQTKQKQ